MRYSIFTGKRSLLTTLQTSFLLASLAWVPCLPSSALATHWQWRDSGGRERIVIQLDAKNAQEAPARITRTGLNTLFISGAYDSQGALMLKGTRPPHAEIVGAVQKTDKGLVVELTNSAFGFVARQPHPDQVVIDVFPDPLGARWQASGGLAPVDTPVRHFTPPPLLMEVAEVEESLAVEVPSRAQVPDRAQVPAQVEVAQVPQIPQTVTSGSSAHSLQPKNIVVPQIAQVPSRAQTPQGVQAPMAQAPQVQAHTPVASQTSVSSLLSLVSEAHAATEVPVGNTSGTAQRATLITPQEIQAPINRSGPEYWPVESGLSTSLNSAPVSAPASTPAPTPAPAPQTPQVTGQVGGAVNTAPTPTPQAQAPTPTPTPVAQAPVAQAPVAQATGQVVQPIDPAQRPDQPAVEPTAEEARPVIYHDEEGNVIPKPPVLEEEYAKATRLMDEAKYREALPVIELLLTMPGLTPDMREHVLYFRSDAVDAIYTGKPLEGYEDIVRSTNEAMNANLRSSRVPDALNRLGMANLRVDNLDEAEGYFSVLKRRYPYDNNVPVAFHLLGRAKLAKKQYAEAEKIFRDILQEYPDSPAVKNATISLVQALAGAKKYEEALIYADFADKRWARYYTEDPEYLFTLADMDYNTGKKDLALAKYWLLYNLLPDAENAPDILAIIGDLYFEMQQPDAAMEVFIDVETYFPDSDAAIIAKLRLAEKGVHDSPISMAEMFAVFENPGTPPPQVVYQELMKERPEDPRSITAQLKYALWQLWNKEYVEGMGTAADFIDLHPENADVEVARDLIMRGFMADLKNSLLEENYGRILTLWNGFPIVRQRYGDIDPDLRNALARGYLERGEDEKAMELFAPFLKVPKHPQYSDPTFGLYFNKYLQNGNWNAMLDLGDLVADWDMTPAMRGQLDYALALAARNLGIRERALDLWAKLENNMDIPKYQRAYATYFLAKDAEERRDIREAYSYNLKALKLFDELKEERSDRADEGRRKDIMEALMNITEVANRIPEALEWVERYNQFVDTTSPEYPSLRFREARLYRKLGNAEKSKQLLELIVNGYKDSPFAAAAASELSTFEVSRDLQNFIPKRQ